jgi:hypothetical protein
MLMFRTILLFLISFVVASPVMAYLPSDPLYGQQGYLDILNMRESWDIAKGNGVVIAVIDSGVDVNHPDLKFNIWKNPHEIAGDGLDNDSNGYVDDAIGWDFIDNDGDPSPVADEESDSFAVNHGTAIAGIISAVGGNGRGMIGIAFNSKIMPLRVLDSDGQGFVDDLVRSIDYAVESGADIINLSLVGFDHSDLLEEAIERAHRSGVTVIAAAGNADKDSGAKDLSVEPAYPACYGNNSNNNIVLAIASVNEFNVKSSFSNYGAGCVDVSVLGERINSLAYYNPGVGFDELYSYNWSGTSFSTALASGISALAKSRDLSLDAAGLIDMVISGTENIDDTNPDFENKLGSGKIDPLKILSAELGSDGQLIKAADSSAVYYLSSNNIRYLFANEKVFFSWYGGGWSDHVVKTIAQSEFDSYDFGKNITVRPGTNLIKFQNSGRVYAIGFGGVLYHGQDDVLQSLYGDYEPRVIVMQNAFENDYTRGGAMDGSFYPDGSVLKYSDNNDYWLIQNNKNRKISPQAFIDNLFDTRHVIVSAPNKFRTSLGQDLTGLEKSIYLYEK